MLFLRSNSLNFLSFWFQDTRLLYSGTYKCTAINKAVNDAYPASLAKEVMLRINPSKINFIQNSLCGKVLSGGHFYLTILYSGSA